MTTNKTTGNRAFRAPSHNRIRRAAQSPAKAKATTTSYNPAPRVAPDQDGNEMAMPACPLDNLYSDRALYPQGVVDKVALLAWRPVTAAHVNGEWVQDCAHYTECGGTSRLVDALRVAGYAEVDIAYPANTSNVPGPLNEFDQSEDDIRIDIGSNIGRVLVDHLKLPNITLRTTPAEARAAVDYHTSLFKVTRILRFDEEVTQVPTEAHNQMNRWILLCKEVVPAEHAKNVRPHLALHFNDLNEILRVQSLPGSFRTYRIDPTPQRLNMLGQSIAAEHVKKVMLDFAEAIIAVYGPR